MIKSIKKKMFGKNKVKLYNPIAAPSVPVLIFTKAGWFIVLLVIAIISAVIFFILGINRKHKNNKKK